MAHVANAVETDVAPSAGAMTGSKQAYRILQLGFVVAPVVSGLDKSTHILVDWDKYLAPLVDNLLGGHGHEFMLAVGGTEFSAEFTHPLLRAPLQTRGLW